MGFVGRFGFAVMSLVALAGSATFAETSAPPAPATTGTVTSANAPSLLLSVGPGLAIYSGNYSKLYNSGSFGYALNASVLGQLSDVPIYLGLDFGLDFWGFNTPPGVASTTPGTTRDLSAVGVQFLPSAVYRFDIPNAYGLHPYFGFSVGPHFMIFRDRAVDTARVEVRSDSKTDVYFELLARPGVDYQFAENIAVNFEPKFGVLNWDFIFLPNVNFVVAL